MADWSWVVAAYALTWTVLGVFAVRTLRGLARARARLEAIEGRGPETPPMSRTTEEEDT